MKKQIALLMVALMVISTTTAGCLGGGGGFNGIDRPDWIPDWAGTGLVGHTNWFTTEVNVRLDVKVTQTYRLEEGDDWAGFENRTGHAEINLQILDAGGANDQNSDSMPDLKAISTDLASNFAKVSVPMKQWGYSYLAGSELDDPIGSRARDDTPQLTWEDMSTTNDYYNGDSLYAPEERTDVRAGGVVESGVELIQARFENYATNMFNIADAVFWSVNIGMVVTVQFTDTDGNIIWEAGAFPQVPILLPFHPTADEDKIWEASQDFRLIILCPMKAIGQHFLNIGVQGMSMEGYRTQMTDREPTFWHNVGWSFTQVGYTLLPFAIWTPIGLAVSIGAIIIGSIVTWVAGDIPAEVGEAFDWGESQETQSEKVWVYGGENQEPTGEDGGGF